MVGIDIEKKRQELLLLWGSQKPSRRDYKQVREEVAKEFMEKFSSKSSKR